MPQCLQLPWEEDACAAAADGGLLRCCCMHLSGTSVPVGLLLTAAFLQSCNGHMRTDVSQTHASVAFGRCLIALHQALQRDCDQNVNSPGADCSSHLTLYLLACNIGGPHSIAFGL